MERPDRPIWFAGDLDDPWVVAIADALPRGTTRIDCPVDLPDPWPIDRASPIALVVHRSTLTATDAQRIGRLKARAERTPRVVVCVGPHARYAEVERWSRLVDAIVPEATARESVARLALLLDRRAARAGSKVAVASTNFELRTSLAEVARSGGFAAEAIADPAEAPPGITTVWDVPRAGARLDGPSGRSGQVLDGGCAPGLRRPGFGDPGPPERGGGLPRPALRHRRPARRPRPARDGPAARPGPRSSPAAGRLSDTPGPQDLNPRRVRCADRGHRPSFSGNLGHYWTCGGRWDGPHSGPYETWPSSGVLGCLMAEFALDA